jgi:hypothetical protein
VVQSETHGVLHSIVSMNSSGSGICNAAHGCGQELGTNGCNTRDTNLKVCDGSFAQVIDDDSG